MGFNLLQLVIKLFLGEWKVDRGRWAVEIREWKVDGGQWTEDSGQWTWKKQRKTENRNADGPVCSPERVACSSKR